MKRYTFTERKYYDVLRDGGYLLYFDEKEGTETVTRKADEEGGEETTETYPVWTYQRITMNAPLEKGCVVDALIRTQYSQADVEAIYRHILAGGDNSEFAEFNTFAEQCKVEANRILQIEV